MFVRVSSFADFIGVSASFLFYSARTKTCMERRWETRSWIAQRLVSCEDTPFKYGYSTYILVVSDRLHSKPFISTFLFSLSSAWKNLDFLLLSFNIIFHKPDAILNMKYKSHMEVFRTEITNLQAMRRWRGPHRMATDKCIFWMWLNECTVCYKIWKINKSSILPSNPYKSCNPIRFSTSYF